jgi:hypothetical protein
MPNIAAPVLLVKSRWDAQPVGERTVTGGLKFRLHTYALFWDIRQRWVVAVYRRLGTTCLSSFLRTSYRSHLLRVKKSWISWPFKMVPERRQRINTQRCVIFQKRSDFISIAAEVRDQPKRSFIRRRNTCVLSASAAMWDRTSGMLRSVYW